MGEIEGPRWTLSGDGAAADDQIRCAELPILPGENLESTDPEDAEHWVAVYEELLDGIHRARPTDGADPNAPVQRIARSFALRLNYWRRRSR